MKSRRLDFKAASPAFMLLLLSCPIVREMRASLTDGSVEAEFPQELFVDILGQIGFRVRGRRFRDRRASCQPFVYRGCQKRVNVALVGPAHYDGHARDLPALIDLITHDWEKVGAGGKQRVKVSQHVVLPDESMGPVEIRVQRTSDHLAPVVDAGGEGISISQSGADFCDRAVCAVLPNRGVKVRAVSAANLSSNLAPVVNDLGESAIAEIKKRRDHVVFPRYTVSRYEAVSRVAYGLAQVVDPKRISVEVASHQRKRLNGAVFPFRRQRNPIIRYAGRAGRVQRAVFRESYDLSTVIDRAGLPVVSAERRESPHLREFPEKRATRKMCAEATNVFAVRVWDSRFGITHDQPEIVDLAPVARSVRSSQRAEVEFDS